MYKKFKNWAEIYENIDTDDYVRNEFLSDYAFIYGKETLINNQDYWEDLNDYDKLFKVMKQIEEKNIKIGEEFWISYKLEVITDLEMIDVINDNLDFEAMNDYLKGDWND